MKGYLTNLWNSTGCTIPAVYALPTWLKQNNYRSPTEGTNSPFTQGFKTNYHFFDFLNGKNPEYPELGAQFNNLMSAYHQGRPSWMDNGFYPVKENLLEGAKTGPEDALIVDVGGNKGHDLAEFRAKWPEAQGRLILQDQPHVLQEIESLHPTIEPTSHDFFTEQPVKGKLATSLSKYSLSHHQSTNHSSRRSRVLSPLDSP